MEDINNKIDSLISVLKLIQQIQLQEFDNFTFLIHTSITFIGLNVWNGKGEQYYCDFYNNDSLQDLKETYNNLLKFINKK